TRRSRPRRLRRRRARTFAFLTAGRTGQLANILLFGTGEERTSGQHRANRRQSTDVRASPFSTRFPALGTWLVPCNLASRDTVSTSNEVLPPGDLGGQEER